MPSPWKAAADALSPIFKPTGNLIPGITPGDWASPQQPIRVSQQLGVGVRSWDFTPGINLQFTPRGDVPISFGQLWRVSNSFDLCRLMIETRKDQVVNRPWAFRVQPKPGETKKDLQARNAADPDVAFLTELWKRPDGVHRFDIWVRMLLEQLLVFDAPCVYPVRNVLGSVIEPQLGVPGGFRLVSGATITPLVDEQGFRPMPPAPAYQQIILGIPTGNLGAANPGGGKPKGKEFTADQLIYAPRNPRVDSRWGFSPVEQIIVTLSIAANRQQFMRDYYTSGNVPEGLLPMPESWTMTQIKDFQTWFDSMLAGNLARKRRMIMIPATEKGAQFSKDKALTDGTDDYLVRVVAYAFSITPQNLIKQVNRGTAKESTDVAQIEGLEPYLKHIENIVNDCAQIVRPGTTAEFAYQDEREMDPYKQAQTDDLYIKSGTYTRNEIREARGDDPRPEPEANELGIVTPTGFVALGESTVQPQGEDDDPNAPPSGGRSTPVKLRKGALRLVAGDLTPKSRQARQEATRILTKFLADQGKRVAKQARAELAKARKLRKDDDVDTATDRALAILALLNWDYPTLMRALQPYLEIAAEQGAQAGSYQVAANAGASLNDTLTTATAKARATAADRAAEMVGLKVEDDGTIAEATGAHWAISTTAKDDVLNAIAQAIKEGWTPEQLEAVIQASTVFSADHAELTADTEVTTQQANGHLAAWSSSGAVLEVQWQCADLGCCAVCRSLNLMGSVPVGTAFLPLLFCPPQHPACRCWLVATKLKSEDD